MSERPSFPNATLDEVLDALARRVAELLQESAPVSHEEHSPWMGIDEAATYLGWPKQRLYKLTAQGAIPHYKHESRLLFRRDEIDVWLSRFAQGGPR